ncbi:hypothetical protein LINPERHAP2_LOCUS4700 [Linum perenne]
MKIHYAGQFSFIVGEGLGYFGGEVMWCSCLDPEEMSLVVIDSYLADDGYVEKLQVTSLDAYRRKNGYFYYWKLEEKQLKDGLKKLTSDKDVLDMGAEVVMVGSVVDVYLSTDASYEEALMHCQIVENTEKDRNDEEEVMNEAQESILGQEVHTTDHTKRKRARRKIDVPEDSDSSGFVDDDNEVSDEETIDIGGFHVKGFAIDTEVMDDADSDYGLSDELNSTCSSDDESGEQGIQKRRDFNKNKEIDDPTFMVGQVFEDFATFKTAVKNHSIITKRPISFLKSDPTRVQVGCKKRTCRWYIYVSKSNDNRGVEIKSCYLVHDGCIMDFKNRFADYKYIARKYVQRFLIDPYWGYRFHHPNSSRGS